MEINFKKKKNLGFILCDSQNKFKQIRQKTQPKRVEYGKKQGETQTINAYKVTQEEETGGRTAGTNWGNDGESKADH